MWPKLASSVMQGWLKIPFTSGLVFWAGGFLSWLYVIVDWTAISQKLSGIQPPPKFLITQDWRPTWEFLHTLKSEHAIVAGLCIILVIALSGVIIKRIDFVTLRLLEAYYWPVWLLKVIEGQYWPAWIKKYWGIFNYEWIIVRKEDRFQELGDKIQAGHNLTQEETLEYARLDAELMYVPSIELRVPTKLGNIMRAFEQRPLEKYGLDPLKCWPRLWLVLPDNVKDELYQARTALNESVQSWLWGFLFIFWGFLFTWQAVPIGLFLMWMSYHWMLQNALTYGLLLESTFDMYRNSLYVSLRWPLPENPKDEYIQGKKLTEYLWRGLDTEEPTFKTDTKPNTE